jgi:hypothetical protein
MKANVFYILRAHWGTLRADGDVRFHRPDILLFFIVPALIAVIMGASGGNLDDDAFSVSISVFSIFSALLLNVQIALFGISQRVWQKEKGSILDEMKNEKIEERRILLSELNTNISYLIVISCFSVTFYLFFYVSDVISWVEGPLSVWIYCHFFLTLLMVIKRAHSLFQKEYEIE